jgi:hypothetical protein
MPKHRQRSPSHRRVVKGLARPGKTVLGQPVPSGPIADHRRRWLSQAVRKPAGFSG